jgi:hypothetical protein
MQKKQNNTLLERLKTKKEIKPTSFILYDGIKFKSNLEVDFYKYSKELGYNFEYEKFNTVLQPGEKLECFVYEPITGSKFAEKRNNLQHVNRIQQTSYSPDFHQIIKDKNGKNVMIIVETKGQKTSSYVTKKKLFIAHINKIYGSNVYFFEPHNLKQIKQVFEILKTI